MLKAVEALQQHDATLKKKRKSQLIEDDPVISLIIAFKKIPDRTIRPHRMYVYYIFNASNLNVFLANHVIVM